MKRIKSTLKNILIISGIAFFLIHMFTQIAYYNTNEIKTDKSTNTLQERILTTDSINSEHIWENTEFID